MSKHIGQLQGRFSPGSDLMARMEKDIIITKLGVQLDKGNFIVINGGDYEIGKTGMLEFDDVQIKSLVLKGTGASIPIIVDYIYETLD